MQFHNPFFLRKKKIFAGVLLCASFPIIGWCVNMKAPMDSISSLTDSIKAPHALIDSAKLTTPVKQKSNQIDAKIDYSATDSIVFMGNGTAYLHGETTISYKTIHLKADFVKIRMDSSTLYASGTQDSTGILKGKPVFKENNAEYESKELTYNLQTKKGYIRQAVTQQGEGYIISDRTKKTSADLLCIAGGKYTTCDNHDHPDFYLNLSKAKVKPGAYIIAGPAHLVIQGVPLPIAIPFGFFPFTEKYSSGIIMPTIQDELSRGFGLTSGGYYFAVNDYMDVELLGDVYTKGTWALTATSNYIKKYKYRGSFGASYREDITGEKGFADYYKAKNLNIRWTHTQDQKANPFRTFSSSVNFSTSGYNRSNINSYYRPDLNSENTKSSSISFTQRFPESPFSLSGSMLLNQRTKDSTINLTLPNISITMGRIYPLKRKNAIGKDRWYEKISMSYSGTLSNSINTKENLLLTSSFARDWKNGIKHSIPISAPFNLFKYINISPSANYTERWYLNSTEQSWDNINQKVIRSTVNGFNRVFDYNFGLSASTKLYGFYMPIRAIFGDKIDRIRHVVTPTLGYSYRPDFGENRWGYYGEYTRYLEEINNPGVFYNETVQYSRFQENLYGGPGKGKSGLLTFGLGNNLEVKVRNDKDSTKTEPFRIISLINNFSVNGAYNMAVDSMQWSNFTTNLQIKLGKGYTLSLGGAFDPYMWGINKAGNPVRINKLR
jgi:lipopolysaccharide export system protein LptA